MKKFLIALTLAASPSLAFAVSGDITSNLNSTGNGLLGFVHVLTKIANALIPFLLAIAVVVFIYGIIKYILANGAEDKAVARGYIIYGIIGIAVIVSLFGLIRLLQGTVGIDGNETVNVPQFPASSSY
jgi:hypothetical protein